MLSFSKFHEALEHTHGYEHRISKVLDSVVQFPLTEKISSAIAGDREETAFHVCTVDGFRHLTEIQNTENSVAASKKPNYKQVYRTAYKERRGVLAKIRGSAVLDFPGAVMTETDDRGDRWMMVKMASEMLTKLHYRQDADLMSIIEREIRAIRDTLVGDIISNKSYSFLFSDKAMRGADVATISHAITTNPKMVQIPSPIVQKNLKTSRMGEGDKGLIWNYRSLLRVLLEHGRTRDSKIAKAAEKIADQYESRVTKLLTRYDKKLRQAMFDLNSKGLPVKDFDEVVLKHIEVSPEVLVVSRKVLEQLKSLDFDKSYKWTYLDFDSKKNRPIFDKFTGSDDERL